MKVRMLVAGTLAIAGILAVPATAMAGEITGNPTDPKPTGMRDHAASECGFSGQEDDPTSPLRTQTPHEVYLGPGPGVVNPPPGTPGYACNPVGGRQGPKS